MEKILKQLLEGQQQLFTEVKQINTRLDGVEVALKENIDITMGLKHWTEEINAQVHGLGHTMTKLEGKVNQLDEKVNKIDDKVSQLDEKVNRIDDRLERMEEQQDIIKADVMFLARKAIEQDEAMYRLRKTR